MINDDFWPEDISPELKNATITRRFVGGDEDYKTYNIKCNGGEFINAFETDGSPEESCFFLYNMEGGSDVWFCLYVIER